MLLFIKIHAKLLKNKLTLVPRAHALRCTRSQVFDAQAIDTWSVGTTLFMALLGVQPWEEIGDFKFQAIAEGKNLDVVLQGWNLRDSISDEALDLLQVRERGGRGDEEEMYICMYITCVCMYLVKARKSACPAHVGTYIHTYVRPIHVVVCEFVVIWFGPPSLCVAKKRRATRNEPPEQPHSQVVFSLILSVGFLAESERHRQTNRQTDSSDGRRMVCR